MSTSRWDWLVEIAVPLKDGNNSIGTGFPVRSDRILTAYHVVCPEDRNEDRDREARLFYQEGDAGQPRIVKKVVWSDEEADLAVVAVALPVRPLQCGSLSSQRPTRLVDWESNGFAAIIDDQATGFSGKLQPTASSVPLDLGVEYKVHEKNYPGASGAPVFVGDQIVGVIRSLDPKFHGDRLQAACVADFMEDEEFRKAVGLPLSRITPEVVAAVRTALDQSDKAASSIIELLAGEPSRSNAPAVAEGLRKLGLQDAAKLFRSVSSALAKDPSSQWKDLQAVLDLLLAIFPVASDHSLIEHTRACVNSHEIPTDSRLGTRLMVEVALAGVDGRVILLRELPIDEDVLRPGATHATKLPEPMGQLDVSGPATLGVVHVGALADRIHDYFFELFCPTLDKPQEVKIKVVAQILRNLHEEESTRYYFVYDPEKDEWAEEFKILKACYDSLIVLPLSRDSSRLVEEWYLIRTVQDIVFRIEQKRKHG